MTTSISRLAQRLRLYDDDDDDDDDAIPMEDVKENALFLAYACPMIEALQRDADQWEIRDESAKHWLDLAADAEDALKDYKYYLEQEIKEAAAAAVSSDERESMDEKDKHLIYLNELSEKIKMIQERFDEINKTRLKLRDESMNCWLLDLRYLVANAEDAFEEYEYHLVQEKEKVTTKMTFTVFSQDKMEGMDGKDKRTTYLNEFSEKIQIIRERFDEINKMRPKLRDNSVQRWLLDLNNLTTYAENILEKEATTTSTIYGRDEMQGIDVKDKHMTFLHEFSKRIRMIQNRFDEINERKMKAIKLKDYHEKRDPKTSVKSLIDHLPNNPIIYGRDEDRKNLLDHLKNNELLDIMMPNQKDEYTSVVIGLVGIGGIGKTTLALELYKHEEINKYFNRKAWVTVSDTFNVVRITKNILESLTGEPSNLTQLSAIQKKLESRLQGKKFFIVLDDVWEENLDSLGFLLQMGSVGSKILITTRINQVINAMHPSVPYNLKPLRIEDGWKLFCRHAFRGKGEYHVTSDLEEIGRKIVERCKGIPLLLKVLGDDFREDVDIDKKRWRDMLNDKTWEFKDDSGNNYVMEILKRSYVHLPSRLKKCFLYCSAFPKDYEFSMDELARLWVAYGLIKTKRSLQLKDIREKYVHNLFQRSFIQKGVESEFSLHDIMHDLGLYILKSQQSLIKNHVMMGDTSQILRYRYEPIIGRTFIQRWTFDPSISEIKVVVISHELKSLRVLILESGFLNFIPDSIGNLKHLRYLSLYTPQVSILPESVYSLFNLQTLKCLSIKELSRDLRRLKRLQHLIVSMSMQPTGIGELIKLQTLRKFHVPIRKENERFAHLSELKDLRQLGGELEISGLENIDDVEEVKSSCLSNKPNLQHLVLVWSLIKENCQPSMLVLDNLKPHNNLESLEIRYYASALFPTWMQSLSFTKLTSVKLSMSNKCLTLPSLGQLPSLRKLVIEYFVRVECIGLEFYGSNLSNAFPSLEDLGLHYMSLSEWWGMDKCPFPRLSTLSLRYCNSLHFSMYDMDDKCQAGLSCMFDSVSHFTITHCPHVEQWCKVHASTTLAKVELMIFDEEKPGSSSDEEEDSC